MSLGLFYLLFNVFYFTGTSNASFTYEVIANLVALYNAKGELMANFADMRFKMGPTPAKIQQATIQNGTVIKNVTFQTSIQQNLITKPNSNSAK
jgi:hypothetical protein